MLVIAVASGKGGVGKTTIAVNLAISLALSRRKTWLLDTDLGLANVDIMLGLTPKKNLSHVLSGECSIEEIIIEGPAGLGIIPSASGVRNLANLDMEEQAGLIWALSDLGQDVDAMVVDLATGISETTLSFARACQEIVVVVCDEPASMTDAYAFMKILSNEFGVRNFHVLANKCSGPEAGLALFKRIARVADRYLEARLDFAGVLPNDRYLMQAVRSQQAVVERYPTSPSAKAFKKLAQSADSWSTGTRPSGDLQFFFEKLLQQAETGERLGTVAG